MASLFPTSLQFTGEGKLMIDYGHEGDSHLGYSAMQSCLSKQMFQSSILPPLSG
jgi:hypothetical protein